MRKHHAYIVKWRDSSSLAGWRSIDDHRHETAVITSVGWVIKQSPKTITLTASISECGNVDDAISIPREAITRMTKLKHHVTGD